jgi:hypothetical protein
LRRSLEERPIEHVVDCSSLVPATPR